MARHSSDLYSLIVTDRPYEPELASRLIIDLDGYDAGFIKKVCDLFEIDHYYDGEESLKLRTWVAYCVKDIVELFTMNPDTLFGTINIGPDLPALIRLGMDPDQYGAETLEEFTHLYKAFAVNIYHSLSRKMGNLISKAIDIGYTDICCDVHRYNTGMLILNVRAIGKIL